MPSAASHRCATLRVPNPYETPATSPATPPAERVRPLTFLGSSPYFGALFPRRHRRILADVVSLASREPRVIPISMRRAPRRGCCCSVAQPLAIRRPPDRAAPHARSGIVRRRTARRRQHGAARTQQDARCGGGRISSAPTLPLSLARAVRACRTRSGIVTRRTMTLHARFMVCTAMTLIDPVFRAPG